MAQGVSEVMQSLNFHQKIDFLTEAEVTYEILVNPHPSYRQSRAITPLSSSTPAGNLPPPFCWHKYGNRQMFPRPTEYPMMLRKNCIFPDQAALSGSSVLMTTCFSSTASASSREARCGGDRTIVTPWRPSPRVARVLSGVISWPPFFTAPLSTGGGVVIGCQNPLSRWGLRCFVCDDYRSDWKKKDSFRAFEFTALFTGIGLFRARRRRDESDQMTCATA